MKIFRSLTLKIRQDTKYPFTFTENEGYLKVVVFATKTGVFDYYTSDGKLYREYRSPEQVFKQESMESLNNKVLTRLHPPEMLNSENTSKYSKGFTLSDVTQEGDYLRITVIVTDKALIDEITSGKLKELSCGYYCVVKDGKGITPAGEEYDGVQEEIIYNHLATVPEGRAGSEVKFKLDQAGNQVLDINSIGENKNDNKGVKKVEIVFNGKTFKLDTAEGLAAYQREVAKVELETQALKTKADELDKVKAENEVLKVQASKVDEKATEKLVLVLDAMQYIKTDMKQEDLVKKEPVELLKMAITDSMPEVKLDGKNEIEIRATFDAMKSFVKPKTENTTPKNDGINNIINNGTANPQSPKVDNKPAIDPAESFRLDSINQMSEGYLPVVAKA